LAGFSVKRGESQNFAGRFGVGSRILKRLKGITIPGKEINMQNPKATEDKVLWKSV
jgi:aldehyde:ferredoxin oxidoreductase